MNKRFLSAVLSTLALAGFAASPAAAQRVNVAANEPIVQFDPARLYGWVDVPNTNSAVTTNITLLSRALGVFSVAGLNLETSRPSGLPEGWDVASQLRVAAVRGPAGLGVELRRARVSEKDGRDALYVQLRVFADSSEFTSGRQLPLEVVLEHTQTKVRTSFFLTVAIR
jgi:hypothetical protein